LRYTTTGNRGTIHDGTGITKIMYQNHYKNLCMDGYLKRSNI
jgi:hypothetical protein